MMTIGILAGLLTCALWGLTFVAARAVAPFSTVDIAVARYCMFGATCLASMLHPRFRPTSLSGRQMLCALLLGGAGYTGYFLAAAGAVEMAGAALPPLIIGLMPAVLAIIGNAQERSVPWKTLVAPLLLIVAGIAVVQWSMMQSAAGPGDHGLAGALLSVVALVIWVVYGLVNARHMRAANPPDGLHWTTVQGLGAAIGSLTLLPFTSLTAPMAAPTGDQVLTFILWALAMGVAGSWLATWCWMIASRRLPLALSAQLVVAETVFALVYGFVFEQRWPTGGETIGILLQLAGVVLAISAFTLRRPSAL